MIVFMGGRSGMVWGTVCLLLLLRAALAVSLLALIVMVFLGGFVLRRTLLKKRTRRGAAATLHHDVRFAFPLSCCTRCGKAQPRPTATDRFCQFCGTSLLMAS
jgi:UDP-N-acetylmuramyl pentapeptide phosphotransferase/UDP-N-acetylglucosamine-1-phosphate transferase